MLLLAALLLRTQLDDAMSRITQAEKLRLIGGYRGFDVQPVESLGMASVRMSDGPVGVRNFGPTTAYAAGICLASTFDSELAREVGEAIGRDARGRGVGFWLGPGVNLSRIPQNGRDFEYFGEDPWLASRCAVAEIEGVQSQGVVATVKHFAANNHENDRNQDSSDVSERVLRELYLRPFEAAVKEARVGAVMCSYNKINGVYASADRWLLTDVLKRDWKFDGVVMSDWGAAHDGEADFMAGLDLEMPGSDFMTPARIGPLVAADPAKQAILDDKVRRILRVCYRFGLVGPARAPVAPRDDPRNAGVARREADEGVVLLRNAHRLLPLKPGKLLVLGANALQPITGGGGSSYTTPLHAESLFQALQGVFPGAESFATPTLDVESAIADGDLKDIRAEYFAGVGLAGAPVAQVRETRIDHVWTDRDPSPAGTQNFSARWTARLEVPEGGTYAVLAKSDDGVRVYVDGTRVIDDWNDHAAGDDLARVPLAAGAHAVRVEYYQAGGEALLHVGVMPLAKLAANPELLAKAKDADAIVLGVGFNADLEGEGHDRPFELPADQQMLLEALAPFARKLVVVVNSGAGVDLAPFVAGTGAILQAWYPGQEGAAALADIISGRVDPSGKLAATFPAALAGTYYASAYPPVEHHMRYAEGLLMGYRWFDAKRQKPLYPFGFGLSYTTFAVSGVRAAFGGDGVVASAVLANTGDRTGTDVVQLYVGATARAADEPVKQLVAFVRVTLKPGERRRVELRAAPRTFMSWDEPAQRWTLAAGGYRAYVGDSSEQVVAFPFSVAKPLSEAP